jgi:vacuolar protein sorting-associated protein 72
MTQDELIAAALEEEERRELRRVGRKRVKGPRWTWVSRTVGKAVEDPTAEAYARNYLILSQIPGGLPAEFSLILGDHTDWSDTQYIPARNRPLVRRPPTCPFTGLPAKYKHPATGVQYANVDGYKQIEALIHNEYIWSEAGWLGREDEGEDMEGWMEAVSGGWLQGVQVATTPDPVEVLLAPEPKRKRK